MLENEKQIPVQLFNFQIDSDASNQLKKGAGWAKFFGIVGLCLSLFAIWGEVQAFIAMSRFYDVDHGSSGFLRGSLGLGVFFTYVLVIVCTIAFLISCIYLIRYSALVSKSVENEDSNLLASAFRNLRITIMLWSICVGSFMLLGLISLFFK